ncbi:hypothetical protein ACH5RR_031117 [Cinchona calisaya]|uniref:F-box domain-containing protein n=1 Tax=Cinchona calisaya TaxID=153742 RepID=A0ABD2YIK1_9GENT
MSDFTPIFPQELITDILLRLPAKSIGQFRCVSKPWKSLLSNPQFIKSHLARQERSSSSHDQEKLILISSSDNSLVTLTFSSNNSSSSSTNDGVSKKISFSECQENWDKVVGSCNGLVLVLTNKNSKFLINPTTFELVKVPNFPLALDTLASFSMDGFGYDSSSDDYKIVSLSYYDTDNEHEPDCADTFVDVFSLKMRTWRRIEPSPYDHAVPELASGVFLNGAIHWLACDTRSEGTPSVIAAFNLNSEEFVKVPPPSSLDKGKFVFNKLVALEGCLGMVVDQYNGQIDVWIMKDYGAHDSWTKFTVNAPEYADIFKPICQLGEKEVVLEKDGEKLIAYNLTEDSLRDIVVAGIPDMFEDDVVTFTESLLSPSFYGWNDEQHIPEGED